MIDYKAIRLKKGLTQIEVCKNVGISLNAYIRIEQGITKEPKPDTLKALKEVLDIKE